MFYRRYHVAKEGYLLGCDEVEAANKMLVTQSWGRDGGQGLIAYRALLKSERFDRA